MTRLGTLGSALLTVIVAASSVVVGAPIVSAQQDRAGTTNRGEASRNAARRAPPDIRVRVVRVSGGPRARIAAARRLVRDKRDDLRSAFSRGLRRAPEEGITVMLDLDVEVGDNGRVARVTAANMPRDATLRRAVDHVLREMRRWRVEDADAHGRFQVRLAFDERPLLRTHRTID
ncbi:MAG: hypothetical protein IT379_07990 [Deltaproteobacteria bacterium]|nr:hypothetical protein [Deltaproteobacteria bacterium]